MEIADAGGAHLGPLERAAAWERQPDGPAPSRVADGGGDHRRQPRGGCDCAPSAHTASMAVGAR